MSRRVETYYDSHAESEWDRLDLHRMEFLTTLRAMNEFIPPRSTNLDVGAGPGRYSIELAKAGHIVTLLDLSPRNVELARQKASNQGAAIAEFVCGKALDLSRFVDSSFEVVLLVGPLYHLVEPSDRDLAINEALRVLKPNGLLFASFISRYRHGLITLRLAVSEGLIAPVEPSVNALLEEAFNQWVEVCYRLGTDPITKGRG
jgi:S-adenosylmethionine-dependent methyltransferase